MRKAVIGILLLAGAAVLWAKVAASGPSEATRQIRIFVLDKAGTAVDIRPWTGSIDLIPDGRPRMSYKLQVATPADWKEKAESSGKGKTPPAPRESEGPAFLCGQVRKLDDWWVEMVYVRDPSARTPEGAQGEDKATRREFFHDHAASYFKVDLDESAVRDAKIGTINFKAVVTFMLPAGGTRTVKGFEYPEGLVDDVLSRTLDKEFKDISRLDHEQAVALSHQVKATLHAVPPLLFKSDADRKEYMKAVDECKEACTQLEQATGKDIEKWAEKCKSALKDVRSQGKEAQGALTAD